MGVRVQFGPRLTPEQEAEEQRIAKELETFDFRRPKKETEMSTIEDAFPPAAASEVRLRYLTYGPTGAYKTRGALEVAREIGGGIVVIDMEKGAKPYAREFGFREFPSTDIAGLQDGVRKLALGGHGMRTLILDGATVLWQVWQESWEDRFLAKNTGRSGHRGEWYEMGMKDWSPVKRTWFAFIRALVGLDMNLLVVANEKAEYQGSGEKLTKIGDVADCEKHIERPFDTVIRQVVTRTGKFQAFTVKDRTGKLPPMGPAWDFSAGTIVGAFGGALAREVRATLADAAVIAEIRALGKENGLNDTKMDELARARYGAASVDELAPENAEKVLAKLRGRSKDNESNKSNESSTGSEPNKNKED